MEFIYLALFGIFSGILAGIFGIGGGTIIVPAMLLTGISIKYAIGISVMQMMFSSVYGSILNIKSRLLNFKMAIYLSIGGACGASFSGFIVHSIDDFLLKIIFSCICFYSLFKIIIDSRGDNRLFVPREVVKDNIILFIIGFITGIFAISLGIGGGLIIVPLVSYYLNMPTKSVVPMSLFFVIFSSISGFSSLLYYGYVDYKKGFIVGIFSLIGVYLGIKMNNKLSQKAHRLASVFLYIIVLSSMIYNI